MKKTRAGRRVPRVTTDGAIHSRDAGRSFPIVGIGASAGGLEAFSALLRRLPLDTGMGFVLVHHLDPEHDSSLTQLLGRATSLTVHEVTNNLHVEGLRIAKEARHADEHVGVQRVEFPLFPRRTGRWVPACRAW